MRFWGTHVRSCDLTTAQAGSVPVAGVMVPDPGDYHPVAVMDHATMLVRNGSGVQLLANVCRHRQAIMLEGRGHAENIVCPLHRWTYDLNRELLGAPHFAENPCVKLASTTLTR